MIHQDTTIDVEPVQTWPRQRLVGLGNLVHRLSHNALALVIDPMVITKEGCHVGSHVVMGGKTPRPWTIFLTPLLKDGGFAIADEACRHSTNFRNKGE